MNSETPQEETGSPSAKVTRKLSTGRIKSDPVIGKVDRYALVKKLGAGGFGAVYLARDLVADVEVALKVLPPLLAHNPEHLAEVQENFKLVAKLRHQNIANVLHLHEVQEADELAVDLLGVSKGDRLIIMDYVEGFTVTGWRRQFPDGKVPLDDAMPIIEQLAEALDYAHSMNIIHRDIKPGNIVIDADGHVSILDFGLAAEIRSSMSRVSNTTDEQAGTPAYMAPEQWAGRRQGAAADLYGLAVVTYEMISGNVPFASAFEGNSRLVMYHAVKTQPPEPLHELSRKQNRVLAKALAKEAGDRFVFCSEFIQTLAGKKRLPRGAVPSPRYTAQSPYAADATSTAASLAKILGFIAVLVAVFSLGGYVARLQEDYQLPEEWSRAPVQPKDDPEKTEDTEIAQQLAEARKSFERKEFSQALEIVRQILSRVPDNSDAEALQEEIRLAVGVSEIIPWRSEAAIQVKRIETFDKGQGFGEAIDRAENIFRAANMLEKAKEYDQALERYRQFLEKVQELEEMDVVRRTALREREAAASARESANAASVAEDAPELMRGANELYVSADGSFEQGEFEEAAKLWVQASAEFSKAEASAKGIRVERIERLAYEEQLAEADQELLETFGGEEWETVLDDVYEAERMAAAAKWSEAAGWWQQASEDLPVAVKSAQEASREGPPDRGTGGDREDALAGARLAELLALARSAKADGDWDAVLRYTDQILMEDAENQPARELHKEAAEALTPHLVVTCVADGHEIAGAEVLVDGVVQDEATPVTLDLERDREYTIIVRLDPVPGGTRYAPFETIFKADELGTQSLRAELEKVPLISDLIEVTETRQIDFEFLASGSEGGHTLQARFETDALLPVEVRTRKAEILLRLIPPGVFDTAIPDDKAGDASTVNRDEAPIARRVSVSVAFYMSIHEITLGQWNFVMEEGLTKFDDGSEQLPVTQVNRTDCIEFCRRLTELEGAEIGAYRLPSEVEWEYVCRAGTSTLYSTGNTESDLARAGWYEANSGGLLHTVGEALPNGWGIFDMHGNVWEWCSDEFSTVFSWEPTFLDRGGEGDRGVVRGGCWDVTAGMCTSAARYSFVRDFRGRRTGFRIVRVIPSEFTASTEAEGPR